MRKPPSFTRATKFLKNYWTIKSYLVAIKGPLTTPVGGGFRSLNVALRQEQTSTPVCDLCAGLRCSLAIKRLATLIWLFSVRTQIFTLVSNTKRILRSEQSR